VQSYIKDCKLIAIKKYFYNFVILFRADKDENLSSKESKKAILKIALFI
jgi:hypothetical protein